MTECARAGLGQSCHIETGLRNPSPANNPELYFPNKRAACACRGLGGLGFYGCHAHVFAFKDAAEGGLEHNPTRRAVEGSFIAA